MQMNRFLTGVTLCGLAFLSSGCSNGPTSPSGPLPVVAGRWEGRFKVVECARVSGEGPSTCRSLLNLVGPIQLRLEQRSASLAGDLSLYGSTSTKPVSGPIHGKVVSKVVPVVSIGGTLRQPEHAIEIRLVEWQTALAESDSDTIAGRYRIRRTFDNAFGRQAYDEMHEIQTLKRIAAQ